jgi:hypothetical protein
MDTRGWNDIAYSFLINHEGTIYEGRGAGIAGGHTAGHNTISHAVCLIGNFEIDRPTAAALASLVELGRHGHAEGWWREGFTGGHRDASGASTSCPGKFLYTQLATINQAIQEDDMPLTTDDIRRIWEYAVPDEDDGLGTRGAVHALRQAWGYARKASIDAAIARQLAEAAATGINLTAEQIDAIADAVSLEVADDLADNLADRLRD